MRKHIHPCISKNTCNCTRTCGATLFILTDWKLLIYTYVCLDMCIHVNMRMHAKIHVHVTAFKNMQNVTRSHSPGGNLCIHVRICIFVYVFVYVYICANMHICMILDCKIRCMYLCVCGWASG